MEVFIGKQFSIELKKYPNEDKQKIASFIYHIKNQGFHGLAGRNKCSDEVPTNDPEWLEKVRYAQQYNLWHYHIGIPTYNEENSYGDWTSEYVIHYIKGDGFVKLVDMTTHPPFKLPTSNYFV